MKANRHHSTEKLLHSLAAALIPIALIFGYVVFAIVPNDATNSSPLRVYLMAGAMACAFTLIRLLVLVLRKRHEQFPRKLSAAARTFHALLYAGTIAATSSAFALSISFGAIGTILDARVAYPVLSEGSNFSRIYFALEFGSLALVLAYLAAALLHEVFANDGIVERWLRKKARHDTFHRKIGGELISVIRTNV